ncbi:hypothetical protein F5876DRAFT_33727 [Lentinula aff. lateritia]|uniref:Uncharacterized protein n=1 Tax=Lentinula aff. lateritia TaxID=2804960 RepID=A0ACC1UAU1_9AGAR|nr:hypothetical protein F5876DRAFT_33727 [Lentinula aff. lateritia]
MRHTDDYLLITADLSKAKEFLRVMNKGHLEYGCFVSRDKTLTNFDHDEQIMSVVSPNQDCMVRYRWSGNWD